MKRDGDQVVPIQMFPTPDAYVRSINAHDSGAFLALFDDDSFVDDNGREFRGLAAIKAWSDREIFGAQVTLKVTDVVERNGATIVTAEVDGTFDRTGLPDPVIIDFHIATRGGRIARLTCRLAGK